MTTRFAGIMAAVTAAMLWGTTGTVQALLPAARDPLAVGALRLSFGALALLAMALAHGPSRRALRGLPWAGLALAGVAVAGYNLLFFRAVEIAGVGIGTAVAIGSAPLWTTAWEIAAQRLWPDRWRGAGQVVSVAGVVLLALAGGGAQGSALGVALAAGAGACYATYSLVTSRLGHRAPPLALAAATFGLGALLTLPVLLLAPPVWLSGAESWAAMAFLGIGATALSYALYTWGAGPACRLDRRDAGAGRTGDGLAAGGDRGGRAGDGAAPGGGASGAGRARGRGAGARASRRRAAMLNPNPFDPSPPAA
ncbi:DMT family transporter [Limimaricola hongkongensis]|uniref:DMT family transporter n=1 Tax=Limimaricola hongkongensis TaxID=278132 RepID=UPI001FE21D97|nr:DMT family transporter [Limimaricola hongkongensis]